MCISVLGLAFSLVSLPAEAQRFSIVKPNSQGGYSGIRGTSATGADGGSIQKRGAFQTDGQGNVEYGTGRSIVTPSGQTYNGTSSGTYNPETGLNSSGTHNVNGTKYESTVENGTATVTDGQGNTRIFTRPFRR
jgi:hypothetical protein